MLRPFSTLYLKPWMFTVLLHPLWKNQTFLSRAKSVWPIQPAMTILPFRTSFKITPLINTHFHSHNSIWKTPALQLTTIGYAMSLWKRGSVWGEFNAPNYMSEMLKLVINPRKRSLYCYGFLNKCQNCWFAAGKERLIWRDDTFTSI